MKKLSLPILLALVIFACDEPENFKLTNAEVFAYLIDGGWEINATCIAEGFGQEKSDGVFIARLSYTVDLITPDNKKLEYIDEGLVDKSSEEEIEYLQVESQFQIDSTFAEGKYKIVMNVQDDNTQKSATIEKDFTISRD
ncbi:hypothetical protein ACSSWA_05365 [Melioribacter sp. Ez-97]|uniref:hypothetical protein n=1 Tax=Melioribacter sp. Ez-97 TaxID=3423434 RepID=UPI003EDA72C5